MARVDSLASHLPALYREGQLVSDVLGTWGVQLDMLDEASQMVQRAHWFDIAPDLDEAAALGALLNIATESFHADINEYRAWVHALVNARLQAGAVTREALRILVDTYVQGFQRAADLDLVRPIASWANEPDDERAALVENPPRMRNARLPSTGAWEPLARLQVTNAGIDPARWACVLTGQPSGVEYAPLIANRTTGDAVVYRGSIAVGERLTIAPRASDLSTLKADLDGTDVTDRLDSYSGLIHGTNGPGDVQPDNVSRPLARGRNDLWFLPLAHFDTPGLGRFLLAFAQDSLRTGRFDKTRFDHSIFAQAAEISAFVAWVEHEPASFEVHVPAHTMRTRPEDTIDAIGARGRLEVGLDHAVDDTAAAGVATDVIMSRRSERQPSNDRLVAMLPRTYREVGPTGADILADSEGQFDVTDFDDSVLR